MSVNKNSRKGLRIWIYMLIFLLVVINLFTLLVYKNAHPSENLWTQLWEYFSSDVFKVVSTSLILPILLIALESYFNFSGAIRERIQSEKEARIEKRLECINKTIKLWDNLNFIISEVVYRKMDNVDDRYYDDLLTRIENFEHFGNEVINMWIFRFTNLTPDNVKLFVMFFNVLQDSTITVIHGVRNSIDVEEKCDLQDSLGAIREGIGFVFFHALICILKLSNDYLEGDLSTSQKPTINDWINHLNKWAESIKNKERNHNLILPHLSGYDEIDNFREIAQSYEKWRRDHPDESSTKFEEYEDLITLFNKLKHQQVCGAVKVPYSLDYIRYLADWFAFNVILQDINEMASWPEKPPSKIELRLRR